MKSRFAFDVFLSYSSSDKPTAFDLATRLRADGLRVWFDEWEIEPGDSIPAKIDEGLERSRVLVLCMSANATDSDSARMEFGTFRFRDPMNDERRFIPLRMDNTNITGSLAQFAHISWLPANRESEYRKLLEACSPPKKRTTKQTNPERSQAFQLDYDAEIKAYAFSPNGEHALTGAIDWTVRLWDLKEGRTLQVLEGHQDATWSVAWSTDQHRALSGSRDATLRLWDVATGECLRTFAGHASGVNTVRWLPDQTRALSASDDHSIRLWDLTTGHCLRVLKGHTASVYGLALTHDGHFALSGAIDRTIRLWNLQTGACLSMLNGNTWSVALNADKDRALTGGAHSDKVVRLWDLDTGLCLRVLEGHTAGVDCVEWSPEQRFAISGSSDQTLRLWDLETGRCVRVLDGHTQQIRSVMWGAAHQAISGDSGGGIRQWNLKRLMARAGARQ